MKHSVPHRRPRRLSVLLIAGAGLSLAEMAGAQVPPEDQRLLEHLTRDLAYYDTALRYAEQLEKRVALDPRAQVYLGWVKVDLYKALRRPPEEIEKVTAEAKRRSPTDPRASTTGLTEIKDVFGKRVLEAFDRAALEPDRARAAELREEAKRRFADEVVKPLESFIGELEKKLEEARKDQRSGKAETDSKGRTKLKKKGSTDLTELMLPLHFAELERLRVLLSYARRLDETDPDRVKTLEAGLKLADDYAENRSQFPAMQFEGQLHRGLFAHELGKHQVAEEHLSLLYGVEPPTAPPYSKNTVDAYKALRLQAILFGARSQVALRNYKRALETLEVCFLAPRKDPFDLSKSDDDPDHRNLGVLVRLEYGITLVGLGQVQKGLDQIQAMIRKPNMPPTLVIDAQKALGRVALMGGVRLRGKDYYEAAIGLKSERSWEEAIATFQAALGSLSARNPKERSELAPICLNEIGEIHLFYLRNYVEAALAYQEVCRYFPTAPRELLSRVATNFLVAANKAIATEGGTAHAGLAKLKQEAAAESEKYSGALTNLEALMVDAKQLENQGKFAEARKKYLEVPREKEGLKVPFYWLAQANAWNCVYRAWDQVQGESKQALEGDIAQAIAELPRVIQGGLKAKDLAGVTKAAFALGNIHFNRGEWKEAAAALKVFANELAKEEGRCYGLGSLIIAEARARELSEAAAHFKELDRECKTEEIAPACARSLALNHDEAGNAAKAAYYAGIYADLIYSHHPKLVGDLEKPAELAEVARILIAGGEAKKAQKFIDKLREAAPGDPELDRTLLWLEAQFFMEQKDWEKTIAKIGTYVEKYLKPRFEDSHYYDAHVLRELGNAFLMRQAKPDAKDLAAAEFNFGIACTLMQQRSQRSKELEATSWKWALEFFHRVKMAQGDLGQVSSYRAVVDFIASEKESNKTGEFGGLKAEFEKLEAEAAEKLKKALEK